MVAYAVDLFWGGVPGESDVEDGVFLLFADLVILVFELEIGDCIEGDEHAESGDASVEGVGDEQGRVEVIQRTIQDYRLEPPLPEKRKTDLLRYYRLVVTLLVTLQDQDLLPLLQSVPARLPHHPLLTPLPSLLLLTRRDLRYRHPLFALYSCDLLRNHGI